jgi:hypothetical protein
MRVSIFYNYRTKNILTKLSKLLTVICGTDPEFKIHTPSPPPLLALLSSPSPTGM